MDTPMDAPPAPPTERLAAPMSTANEPVPPGAPRRTIRYEFEKPFIPERMFISAADFGGDGTAANWEIDDIRIDGKSIRKDDEPLSGALWATNRVGDDRDRVMWRRCERSIEIDVRYVGKTKGGTPFYGAVIGNRP